MYVSNGKVVWKEHLITLCGLAKTTHHGRCAVPILSENAVWIKNGRAAISHGVYKREQENRLSMHFSTTGTSLPPASKKFER